MKKHGLGIVFFFFVALFVSGCAKKKEVPPTEEVKVGVTIVPPQSELALRQVESVLRDPATAPLDKLEALRKGVEVLFELKASLPTPKNEIGSFDPPSKEALNILRERETSLFKLFAGATSGLPVEEQKKLMDPEMADLIAFLEEQGVPLIPSPDEIITLPLEKLGPVTDDLEENNPVEPPIPLAFISSAFAEHGRPYHLGDLTGDKCLDVLIWAAMGALLGQDFVEFMKSGDVADALKVFAGNVKDALAAEGPETLAASLKQGPSSEGLKKLSKTLGRVAKGTMSQPKRAVLFAAVKKTSAVAAAKVSKEAAAKLATTMAGPVGIVGIASKIIEFLAANWNNLMQYCGPPPTLGCGDKKVTTPEVCDPPASICKHLLGGTLERLDGAKVGIFCGAGCMSCGWCGDKKTSLTETGLPEACDPAEGFNKLTDECVSADGVKGVCTPKCTCDFGISTTCGDGKVDPGEDCELPGSFGCGSGVPSYTECTATCRCVTLTGEGAPFCGDGVVDAKFKEACDKSDTVPLLSANDAERESKICEFIKAGTTYCDACKGLVTPEAVCGDKCISGSETCETDTAPACPTGTVCDACKCVTKEVALRSAPYYGPCSGDADCGIRKKCITINIIGGSMGVCVTPCTEEQFLAGHICDGIGPCHPYLCSGVPHWCFPRAEIFGEAGCPSGTQLVNDPSRAETEAGAFVCIPASCSP